MSGPLECHLNSDTETLDAAHAAALVLSWLYALFYCNYEVSNQILEMETERFPSCPPILVASGYVQRKQGNIEKSHEYFERASAAVPALPAFQVKMTYERGTNHFLLMEWEPACDLLSDFLKKNKAEAFRTYCAFQIAICWIMRGKNDEATVYMKMVGPWVRKVPPKQTRLLKVTHRVTELCS